MFKKPVARIMFSYSVWQDLYDQMKNEIPFIEFYKGFPPAAEMHEWGGIKGH